MVGSKLFFYIIERPGYY